MLYAPLVFFWCRKFGVADQDIPDVVQDVFQSVATGIDQFRKDRAEDTFRGWLCTISKNKSIDHLRRGVNCTKAAGGSDALRLLHQFPDDNQSKAMSDDVNDVHVYHDLYLRACDLIRTDFKERTWKAFWRVVVDGQSPKDVAYELSMKPGTVRVAKSRVLHRLRQELGELPE
jgi:RNA polymerase sigma-70 factor (ECF subfamily)